MDVKTVMALVLVIFFFNKSELSETSILHPHV